MLRIVINHACARAPFNLSPEAARRYVEACGLTPSADTLLAAATRPRRDDARLVAIVEAMGSAAASGHGARIVVVELPPLPNGWHIEAHEGGVYERIYEHYRTWDADGLIVDPDADDRSIEECDARFAFAFAMA